MLLRFTLAFSLSLVATLSSIAQISAPSQAVGDLNNSVPNSPRIMCTVSGTVYSRNGQPLPNARVELRSAENGSIAGTGYSGQSGEFSLANVEAGLYDISALSGVDEISQQVRVSHGDMPLTLRIPTGAPPQAGESGPTVSISHLKVPDKARKEFQRGEKAFSQGKSAEARVHVKKALEILPNYAEALTLNGILDLTERNIDSAVENLQQAIDADPSYATEYFVMAAALNQKEQYKHALATAERGVALNPAAWQGHYEMAKANLGLGEFEAALQCARRAAATNEKFPGIQLAQANALMGLRRYSEATKLYREVLSSEPSGPNSAAAEQGIQQANSFTAHDAER